MPGAGRPYPMNAAEFIDLYGADHPLVVVLVALAGDMVLAGVPGVRVVSDAPAKLLSRLSRWFEARLNRPRRSAANRAIRGGFVLVVFVAVAGVGGAVAARLIGAVPEGWLIAAAAVALFLTQRRQFDRARSVGRALRDEGLEAGRTEVAKIVAYDSSGLDAHGVARGAVQSCAQYVPDGVIGPVFWYLLLGLPGLCAYRSVNALAREGACSFSQGADYCRAATALNRVLSYVPAALGGIVMSIAAAFVPTARPFRALRMAFREGARSLFLASQWTEAAMAGALGLALGGPVRYAGAAVSLPWIGDGRARAMPQDISRAAYLFAVTALLTVAIVALAALWISGG